MPTDQSTALPWREKMTFSPQTRGTEVTRLAHQHAPDFLLTWRPMTGPRDVFTPDPGAAYLSGANGQHATSEAEALQRWLAAGGDLDVASRYGLEIIAGDETLDRFSNKPSGEEATHGQSRTVCSTHGSLPTIASTRQKGRPLCEGRLPMEERS